ncbi:MULTISPECIES: glycosyltransferase family 4 protein [unclassified Serratia (in: enterobacteria)]|uniref:glycosyltransferase family 4 protein n=1 Tax=unclassified Serratia (in: enterobacteria) TaxID=2647522 RepID=UPI0027E5C2F5|nr:MULTISPECIES: glycosyltransferase family 4 protein [unclassified Serratia (in: enterobacteria)]MDQ7101140.1 glycosyltransferase family 4 protein [Serratia sp. MF2]MDQ7102715.1 glycosyltransferase family 4 protein [Serratia sp. MF1(2023)]
MKKVLVLTNEYSPFNGGISRYTQMLVQHKPGDISVELIAPSYQKEESKDFGTLTVNRYSGGKFTWKEFPQIIREVAAIQPSDYDRVHVADWPFWLAVCFRNKFMPWKEKIKFTSTVYGSEILNFRNGRISPFVKILSPFKDVTALYPISEYTRNIMVENFPESEVLPCKTVLLGIDESWRKEIEVGHVASIDDVDAARDFVLVTVGRLDSRKGHDLVIKAISQSELAEKITYNIIGRGDDSYKKQLNELAEKHCVHINIFDNLNDDEVKSKYRESDLFVLAARTDVRKVEGFGLVFLEAAACGVPSLATNVGAIPEVVSSELGVIVEESSEGIAKAIRQLYYDAEKLAALKKTCGKKAASYSWEKTAQETFA